MKTTRNVTWVMIATISTLWFAVEPQFFTSNNLFEWRSAIIQYSGILSLILMSITMILAMRLSVIENWLSGMDKAYRIHKWLGISSIALGISHWLWYQIPKWLVMSGILTRPARQHDSKPVATEFSWNAWVNNLHGFAENLGEWGFYLLLALLMISLWATVKYKPFKLSHRLMSVAYLLIVVHSVLLLKHAYWGEPIYYLTLGFAFIGSIAAMYSLLGFVGRSNRHAAVVVSTRYFPQAETMELILKPNSAWQGHTAGQFAYLQFGNEDPHPFTIVSGTTDPEIRFLIKALGDFTTGLHERVKIGDAVTVEGPYGRVNFGLNKPQVWIAGGVGIAAFFAILETLKGKINHPRIDLFYCNRGIDNHLADELYSLTQQAGVRLNVIDTLHSPRLNIDYIATQCGNVNDYDFYFCGPEIFSKTLTKALGAHSFDIEKNYHEELFVMR
ncbi:ferric reductase-like transmembrane domain-containing protein [Photobacterium carnosum]|uniref:ferredoxin reductase family protein n=1 Tax=Photobacterium carnosum TaxID=2023717 RepID=UPI001E5F5C95|nr:ferric reductase-like transmembrane domain-containing protein [Photobacterium carnosum]MCD9497288.1 ferric reductase [Photobacterium carnosum]